MKFLKSHLGATFQVLKSYMWLMAIVLDRAFRHHKKLTQQSCFGDLLYICFPILTSLL